MKTSLRLFLSWQAVLSLTLTAVLCGCGVASVPAPPVLAGVITQQPASASVPAGMTATFLVGASGVNLSYQWYRNGAAISGATASTYTTQVMAYADSGAVFTVTVSNAGGSVTSSPATLTVTARAPVAGDLRFSQVDSATTVNGYSLAQLSLDPIVFCPPPGGQAAAMTYGAAIGTSFQLGNNGCGWSFLVLASSASVSSGYGGTDVSNLQAALAEPMGNMPSPDDPLSVVVATGVASVDPSFVAFGYVHDSSGPAYTCFQATVSMAALPAAAAQEAAQGHVITALYVIGSNVTYFSYAWAGDPNGVYETQVVSGNLAQGVSMVQDLAAGGYIVTASTSTYAADGSGLTIVGTRFKGDTTPRPFLEEDVGMDQLMSGGYALVLSTHDWTQLAGQAKYMGER